MFCPKCGAKIEKEKVKFCPKCGAKICEQPEESVEEKLPEVRESEGKQTIAKQSTGKIENNREKRKKNLKPKKSKKKWLIVLLVIVVLGAVGATIMMKKTAAVNKSNQEAAKSSDTEVVDKKIEDETTEDETTEDETTEDETTGETTSDEEKDATDDSDAIIPGSNMADAVLVPLGTKVFGTVKAGENAWFSFTTGETEGATYNVTYVNGTVDSEDGISGYLYDEYGTPLYEDEYDSAVHYVRATADGTPITISSNELETNTTYYIRLESRDSENDIDYSVVVKDPASKSTAYKTKGSFSETGGTANEQEGEVKAGTNQSAATFLALDTKVSGTIETPRNAWFSFTTGETEGATYNVTYVNGTVDSEDGISGYLYDEYGTPLYEDEYDSAVHYVRATADGTPITISSNELETNTTYYIRLEPRDNEKEIKYTLSVKSPEEKKDEKAALVFEVPFEINETQVQFVINEATFIDKEQAKEAVKPVAEAVLNAPEHAILIAGTTATDGTQESCIDLSNRRAQAVKDLLVNTYNVPESQIKTVGLGYEADPFERGADRDANGKFVESEAKKNRRVVILDVDDPIAQQLLSK